MRAAVLCVQLRAKLYWRTMLPNPICRHIYLCSPLFFPRVRRRRRAEKNTKQSVLTGKAVEAHAQVDEAPQVTKGCRNGPCFHPTPTQDPRATLRPGSMGASRHHVGEKAAGAVSRLPGKIRQFSKGGQTQNIPQSSPSSPRSVNNFFDADVLRDGGLLSPRNTPLEGSRRDLSKINTAVCMLLIASSRVRRTSAYTRTQRR